MAIGTKSLVECINKSISTASTALQVLQLASATKDFEDGFVYSVANIAALPSASLNTGRMVYVQNICSYRISDGTSWTSDFTSILVTSVWAWGYNAQGQLGDGTTTNRSSPVSVVGGFTDWCQVSASSKHTLGVRANGTAWGWGFAYSGQLGDGLADSNKSSPVSVVGGFTDWRQVSAGYLHGLGLRTNGSLWAWGENLCGALGDGTVTNKSSPVSVVGGFTDWCQISAGQRFSAAVRSNGSIWTWGCNTFGQLGDGTTVSRSSPVSVVGGFTNWCQVSAGTSHIIGIRTNGTLWAWGSNTQGQLGDGGFTASRLSPVSVVGGFTDWCQVSNSYSPSFAIRTNGTAWGWGYNASGQLGNNSTVARSSPVSVVGGFTDWCQVSAGSSHTIGLRTNGTLWAWGSNNSGNLGNNSTTSRSSPVSVVGGFNDWCQIAAGGSHTVGIRTTGRGF